MLWVGEKRDVLNDDGILVVLGTWSGQTSPYGIPIPSHNAVDVGVDPTRKTYQP